MADTPLAGDGVNLFADPVHFTDSDCVELLLDLLREHQGSREQTQSAAAKGVQKSVIFELANDTWADLFTLQFF